MSRGRISGRKKKREWRMRRGKEENMSCQNIERERRSKNGIFWCLNQINILPK
jgi:hypothetical protein